MSGVDIRAACAAAAATALGTCALTPVFSSLGWAVPVLAAVLAVLVGGLILRLGGPAAWARATHGRPVPRRVAAIGAALVPAGQLFLVLCLLTARYAPGTAALGVLPTRAALVGLGSVLAEGWGEMQVQATPAVPVSALVALTVVFVGVLAVIVDLVAVAGRQAALAGVALAVLYCIPVATITGGIGLVAVLAPATGLALLLRIDQRRRLAAITAGGTGRKSRAGSVAAVRVGLSALVAAVVLGSLVPTLGEGSLAGGMGGGAGNGSTGTALDPVAEMRGELQLADPIDLLRVRASVRDPGYLRAVSLEQYDSGGWSMTDLTGETPIAGEDHLSPPQRNQQVRQVRVTVEVLGHDDRFLPVPSFPLSIRMDEAGGWRFDPDTDTVYGRGTSTAGLKYTVLADEPRPTPQVLAQSVPLPADDPLQQRFTLLPDLDPTVLGTVGDVVGDAATPYERVRRIHAFLSDPGNGFRYTLATQPGTSGDDLADFLRLRRGYCEQYAGAMAVMARAANVPARVVLGYTSGRVQSDGSRLITSDDAHAWVEVYFRGLGWVPFDPTPISRDRAARMPWAQPSQAAPTDAEQLGTAVPAIPSQAPPSAPRADGAADAATTAAAGSSSSGIGWPALAWTAGTALLLTLLLTPAAARAVQRRRRVSAGEVGALWDELTATARDLDIRVQPTWTPRRSGDELARVLERAGAGADGRGVEAVRRLARAEETASYGPAREKGPHPDLAVALRTARRALLKAAARPARWRARLWPPSLLAGVGWGPRGGISNPLPAAPGSRPRSATG